MPQRGHQAVARWPMYSQPRSFDDLQEPPDVLDVRVAEGEVVLAPVHPLPEADRAARQLLGRLDDDLAAARGELLEAVLLDLALRVEARAAARPRPRSTAPGSRSRSGSAGRSPGRPCSAGRRPSASSPTPCATASFLFAVTGPSMNDHFGPPRFFVAQRLERAARAPSGRAPRARARSSRASPAVGRTCFQSTEGE